MQTTCIGERAELDMSDLRRLVTATSQLQQQLQDAVHCLEQQEGTLNLSTLACWAPEAVCIVYVLE